MKLLSDCLRDFALDSEQVLQIAIVLFRPDVRIGSRIDQLRVYVEPAPVLRTLPSSTCDTPKGFAYLVRISLGPILHDASAADDLESGNVCQLR